jgi:AbrB family looped-hinge helix DNA binding protein
MQFVVFTEGQVVLPSALRRRLGIRAGDALDALVENGRIILTPRKRRTAKGKIATDPVTGLPVLTAVPGAPLLKSRKVYEILATLP